MRTILILAPLVLLAACGAKPAPEPAAKPAAATSDFSKPIGARGHEPFWSLTIRGTTLTLSRPDHPDLVATAPGASIQPSQASWTGKTANGDQMKVTLYASACSDGMSDHAYPWSAEVALDYETPLTGCADKTTALPAAAPRP